LVEFSDEGAEPLSFIKTETHLFRWIVTICWGNTSCHWV